MCKNPIIRKSAGITLVELMIAMVIGLVIMGALIQVVVTTRTTYTLQDTLSRIQENARFATDMMGRELRMAGYGGCAGNGMSVANTVSGSSGAFASFKNGIQGYEGGVDTLPSDISGVLPNTDVVFIHRVSADSGFYVDSHNPSSAVIHLNKNVTWAKGTILVIVEQDCSQMGIFVMSGPNSTNPDNVVHNTGASTPPYDNCTKKLKGDFDCSNDSAATSGAYGTGSTVYQMASSVFYLKNNSFGYPSLYQKTIAGVDTELVPGVEDLRILYGVDTDSTFDGVPNRYVSANAINSSATLTWEQVTAARVHVLVRSMEAVLPSPEQYEFAGTTVTPTDNYLRKEFVATIQLRNRSVQ